MKAIGYVFLLLHLVSCVGDGSTSIEFISERGSSTTTSKKILEVSSFSKHNNYEADTNLDTIKFSIEFNQDVLNFGPSDLTTTVSGSVSLTGMTVTGSGSSYEVTVHGVSGDGDLSLSILATNDIATLKGKSLDMSKSTVSQDTFTIDNTVPATITAPLYLAPPLTSPGTDNMPTVVTSGTVANETLRLYKDAQCLSADLIGTLDITDTVTAVQAQTPIVEGVYTLYMDVIDKAGNISGCSDNSITYEYNDQQPPVRVSTLVEQVDPFGSITKSPVLTWTTDVSAGNYKIAIGSTPGNDDIAGYVNVGTSGSAQITGLTLVDTNTYYATIVSIDPLGNEATPTSSDGWLVQHDTVAPNLLSVTSDTNSTFFINDTVNVKLIFDEDVLVADATPSIQLETGTVDRYAFYQSGSGTKELVFSYVVQKDDSSSDLDLLSRSSVYLNGATIADAADNNATIEAPVGVSPNSLASLNNIVIDGTFPIATTSDEPSYYSHLYKLNILVGGTSVVSYRYKVGQESSIDCSVDTGYSTEIGIGTRITDNLGALPDGTLMELCVRGKSGAGAWQPANFATTYTWTKESFTAKLVSIPKEQHTYGFLNVGVSPDNGNIIFAQTQDEMWWRSTDTGLTWEKYCRSDRESSMTMVDYGANPTYAISRRETTSSGQTIIISDQGGGACYRGQGNQSDFSAAYMQRDRQNNYYKKGLTGSNPNSVLTIYKSQDHALTWTPTAVINQNQIATGENWSSGQWVNFGIKPDSPETIYFNVDSSSWFYKTSDAGVTVQTISTSSVNVGYSLFFDLSDPNRIYYSGNDYSLDGGATFSTDPKVLNVFENGYINASGVSYYADSSPPFDTILYKTTQLPQNAWVEIRRFRKHSDSPRAAIVSTSDNNNTIAVLNDGQLFISTDAGVTFHTRNHPVDLNENFYDLVSDDFGDKIYASQSDYHSGQYQTARIWETSDSGVTWSPVYTLYNSHKQDRIQFNTKEDRFLSYSTYGSTSNIIFKTSGGDILNNHSGGSQKRAFLNPIDKNQIYLLGGSSYVSNTLGDGWESISTHSIGSKSSVSKKSFMNPISSNLSYYVNFASKKLYEYNLSTKSTNDITSNTNYSNISGLNAIPSYDSNIFKLRIITDDGYLDYSTDQGATFTSENSSATALSVCSERLLETYDRDHSIVATACYDSDTLHFSFNNGKEWKEVQNSGCKAQNINITRSNVFLACGEGTSLIVDISQILFVNNARDGIINSTENSQNIDLIELKDAYQYSSVEYALIPYATPCDSNVTFSPTVPKSDDATFAGDGKYKICIKKNDAHAGIVYEESSSITLDTTAPAFTSIDLANDAADTIITLTEKEIDNPLVTNLTGSDYDNAYFAVVNSSDTCSSVNDSLYNGSTPKNTDSQIISTGSFKVCVKLDDFAGNTPAYGASASFTVVGNLPYVTFSNKPTVATSSSALSVTVNGFSGADEYKHKLTTNSNGCTDSTGYSASTPIGTPITDALSHSDGTKLYLCAVGIDTGGGYAQPFSMPTVYRFSKDDTPVVAVTAGVAISSITYSNFTTARIDPTYGDIFVANSSGEFFYSADNGSNWEKLCHLPNYYSLGDYGNYRILPSNKVRKVAFFHRFNGFTYRIENRVGGECHSIVDSIDNTLEFPLTMNNNGEIFISERMGSKKIRIAKSNNAGKSWSTHYVMPGSYNSYSNHLLSTHQAPSDASRVYRLAWGGTFDTYGVQKLEVSNDEGVTFTEKTIPMPSFPHGFVIDPTNANNVIYANNYNFSTTYISTDGMDSWNNLGSDYAADLSAVEFGDDGAVYRLERNGFDQPVLEKNTNLLTPSWTPVYTFTPTVTPSNKHGSISVRQGKITVTINSDFYVSSDNGTTFTKQNALFSDETPLRIQHLTSNLERNQYVMILGDKIFETNEVSLTNFVPRYTLPNTDGMQTHISPANPSYMYAVATGGGSSVYNQDFIYSHDGGVSWTKTSTQNRFEYSFAMDLLDENKFYSLNFTWGSTTGHYSNDGGVNISNRSTGGLSTGDGDQETAFINPADSTEVLYISPDSHKMWIYDYDADNLTEITSNVGGEPSVATFTNDGGTYRLRVLESDAGDIFESTDFGTSFSLIGTVPSLSSCSAKPPRFYTDPLNPDYMVLACQSSFFDYTTDGGTTWTRFIYSNWNGATADNCYRERDNIFFTETLTNPKIVLVCGSYGTYIIDI